MTELAWGAASDVGRVRQNNQDTFLVSDGLFAVADGMGGHRGGEVASDVAITSIRDEFVEPTTEALVRAVQVANDKVVGTATGDPDLEGMGTTLCALALVQVDGADRLAIVNVGDSRVYLCKGEVIEQVTDDHSLVATLERQGRLTPAEAAIHPQRNILTRALGIDARVMVDSWEVRPVTGDRYVLCSDGLFNEVDDTRIASTLRRLADPTDAARELVRLANEGGGHDNITVVVVDVIDGVAAGVSGVDGVDGVAGVGGDTEVATGEPERVMAAVSGEARAIGVDAVGAKAHVPTRAEQRAARKVAKSAQAVEIAHAAEAAGGDRASRTITWRVLLFVAAALAVLGIGAAAVTYYGRHTYYVGFDQGTVVVYQGRPGGVLWIQPQVVERTSIDRTTVPAASLSEIERGKIEPTLDDAHRYITNLSGQIPSPSTATATTTVAAGN